MTDLEKRAEEFDIGGFCGMYVEEDIRALLVKFANAETALLSKHILDLQKDKGRLTDENKQAKEIIRNYYRHYVPVRDNIVDEKADNAKAEAFLYSEVAK